MSQKKLWIQGDISESDIESVRKLLDWDSVSVGSYVVKSGEIDSLFQLVFDDFDIIAFTRDFSLGSAFNFTLSRLIKVVKFLKSKGKSTDVIAISKRVKNPNGTFLLTIVSNPDKIKFLIEYVEQNITVEFVTNVPNKSKVQIVFNSKGEVEVVVL